MVYRNFLQAHPPVCGYFSSGGAGSSIDRVFRVDSSAMVIPSSLKVEVIEIAAVEKHPEVALRQLPAPHA